VRCAKCRESWFQDGPSIDGPPAQAAASQAIAQPQPSPAPASTAGDDGNGSEQPSSAQEGRAQATAFAETLAASPPPPPVGEAHYDPQAASQFDAEPPFRRRRNPLKMWTWAAGIFAVVVAGLIVAVSYFGLPDWVPVSRPTFAASQPDLQLDFPAQQQERRELPNGTEFFGASGVVTNIGTQERVLPTILIVLRDARNRIVYSWEVPPPKRTLAPGESVSINEAVTDVPRSARTAEIGWKPE